MRVLQTVPLLRIFDVAKAREFYVDFQEVVDPFGRRLRFYEDLSPAATITPA